MLTLFLVLRRLILPNERLEGNIKRPRQTAFRETIKRVHEGPPCYPRDIYGDPKIGLGKDTVKHNLELGVYIGIFKQLGDGRYAWIDYEAPEHVSKLKISASEILRQMKIFEDDGLPPKIRLGAGIKIELCCSSIGKITGDKSVFRSFFLRILDNFDPVLFVAGQKVLCPEIFIALKEYVAFQFQGEKDTQWMVKKCYPKLISVFNDSSIEKRECILEILSEILDVKELYKIHWELNQFLRERFFDPIEDDRTAMNCLDIIISRSSYEEKDELEEEVLNMTKHKNEVLKERGANALWKIMQIVKVGKVSKTNRGLNRDKT